MGRDCEQVYLTMGPSWGLGQEWCGTSKASRLQTREFGALELEGRTLERHVTADFRFMSSAILTCPYSLVPFLVPLPTGDLDASSSEPVSLFVLNSLPKTMI